MQFVPNGPNVPEKLIREHEEGNVVFFCGAGISIPSGLPSFRHLVELLNKELHLDLDDDIKKTPCDQILDELEHTCTKKFRPKLIDLLKTKKGSNIDTHLALLKLATQSDNEFIRLVTTNYDRLFEKACRHLKIEHKFFAAPTLPVPKKSKWDGIVYLHGLLPKKQNATELNNLVITSGDFGLAYLTERWASRFVSELFRNFSVCFIGYSLSDPVMRYMTDAISADRMSGEKLPKVWAFASYDNLPDKQIEFDNWKKRGIEPILYSSENNHSALHQTIQTWENIYADGANGKEMVVAKFAGFSPTASTQDDNFVSRVLWALADPSCKPAQRFANLDPTPSLDWLLGPFSHKPRQQLENDIELSFSAKLLVSQYLSPFAVGKDDTLAAYHPIYPIVQWTLKHLNDERLLLWVLEQGDSLRTYYKSLVLNRLEQLNTCSDTNSRNAKPDDHLSNLWKLFAAGALSIKDDFDCDFYLWKDHFEKNNKIATLDLRLELRKALAPKIFIHKSPISKTLTTELRLSSDYIKDALREFDWGGSLHHFIQDFQQLLRDAIDLSNFIKNDHFFDLPSIESHPQNKYSPDYTVLIELLRDSWLELLKKEPIQAKLMALQWLYDKELLFKRLGLFAASIENSISCEHWIDCLLVNDCQNLWDIHLRREVLRLLAKQGSSVKNEQITKLETALLKGPESSDFSKELLDHTKWLYLAKFQSSGIQLSEQGVVFLKNIQKEYPTWALADDKSDEFPIWYSGITDIDTSTPISAMPKSETEICKWLREQYLDVNVEEKNYDWKPRVLNQWRLICAKHLVKAARVTNKEISQINTDHEKLIWQALFDVASEKSRVKRTWKLFSDHISKLNKVTFEQLTSEITWWMHEASKWTAWKPSNFFEIANRVLAASVVSTLGDEIDSLTKSINHPLGRITLSILNLLFSEQPHDNQGIKKEFKIFFNSLCDLDKPQYLPARIVLCAHLVPLFRIDSQWTEKELLPLFDWKKQEAADMWIGFLWSPRPYLPLIEKLKPRILETTQNYHSLGNHEEKFSAFITAIALENNSIFSDKELRQLLNSMPSNGLKRVAIVLCQRLKSAGDKKSNYWKNRIKPFIEKIWPSQVSTSDPLLSNLLIKVAIASGENFPEAAQVISNHLTHLERRGFIFNELIESKCCKNFPRDTLQLLNKIHPTKREDCLSDFHLKNCLVEIGKSDPSLKREKIYRKLADLTGLQESSS